MLRRSGNKMIQRHVMVLAGGASLLLAASALHAGTVTWDGGGADRYWSTPENWSGNVLPASSDDAQIDGNTQANSAILNSATSINMGYVGRTSAGYLDITSGGSLSVTKSSESNGLYVGYGSGSSGVVSQSGGDVAVTGGVHVGYNAGSNGKYTLSGGTLTGGAVVWAGQNGNGEILQTGGTLNITNNGANVIRIGDGATGNGLYTITGGKIITAGGIRVGPTSTTGTGKFVISGSADIIIGGQASQRSLTISSHGTLVIDGAKTAGGTDVGVTGVLSTTSGAVLRFLMDDAAIADPTAMRKISALDCSIASGTLLDVGFSDGATPGAGTWTVLTWSRTDPTSINNISFASTVDTNHWSYNLDLATNTLTVSYAVPEVSAFALLAVSGGMALLRRGRRA